MVAGLAVAVPPTATAGTGVAPRTVTGQGKILYARDGSLAIRKPDGSGVKGIPRTKYWDDPQWSPNGRWIAATKFFKVWVIRPDGTGRKRISPPDPAVGTRYASGPAWSPDGRSIAYVLQIDNHFQLRIVRRDGTVIRKLALTRYEPASPAWSPAGNRIAFSGTVQPNNPAPQFDIFTIRTNGTHLRRLTASRGADEIEPAWRPDGKRIAYHRIYFHYRGAGSSRQELYVMRPSGADKHGIFFDYNGYGQSPTWSPNGKRIAFGFLPHGVPAGDVDYGIRTMRPDGTGMNQVSTDLGKDPSWRAR
jgi:Tol biopolymer transport system component